MQEWDVEVRNSVIEGLGVFAARPYEPGESIRRVNIVRGVTEDAPLRPEAGERPEHCAYPDGGVVLWGFPDRHLNHCCDPNAYELHAGDGSGAVHIVARHSVRAGEEITLDYNINIAGGSSGPCLYGAARCRGETIGDYFKLPEDVQLEYLPLLADWFVSRHVERVESLRRRAPPPSW